MAEHRHGVHGALHRLVHQQLRVPLQAEDGTGPVIDALDDAPVGALRQGPRLGLGDQLRLGFPGNGAVKPQLGDPELRGQPADGLVVLGVHRGVGPVQVIGEGARDAGGVVDHLFLRVKAVDVRRLQVLDQAAPEVHVEHLTAPADAQHREVSLHRPGQDGKVLLVQLRGDLQAARQGLPVPGGVHVGHAPGEDQAGAPLQVLRLHRLDGLQPQGLQGQHTAGVDVMGVGPRSGNQNTFHVKIPLTGPAPAAPGSGHCPLRWSRSPPA